MLAFHFVPSKDPVRNQRSTTTREASLELSSLLRLPSSQISRIKMTKEKSLSLLYFVLEPELRLMIELIGFANVVDAK